MAEITRNTTDNTIGTGTGGLELSPSGSDLVTINNGVVIPDGTAASPAIRMADDTDCGLYSATNDQVNLAAHGVEMLRVTGVSSAVNLLELKPSVTTSPLEINAVGTDTDIDINLVPKGAGVLKSGGTAVSLSTHNHSGVYEPADATILKDADIGVNVAAYSHVHEGTTIDATGVTDGYVLTADGAGNAAWEAAAGGGGATGYHYSDTPTTDPAGTGAESLVIGDGADGNEHDNLIIIGNGSNVATGGTYKDNHILIGKNLQVTGTNNSDLIAIGRNCTFSKNTTDGNPGIYLVQRRHWDTGTTTFSGADNIFMQTGTANSPPATYSGSNMIRFDAGLMTGADSSGGVCLTSKSLGGSSPTFTNTSIFIGGSNSSFSQSKTRYIGIGPYVDGSGYSNYGIGLGWVANNNVKDCSVSINGGRPTAFGAWAFQPDDNSSKYAGGNRGYAQWEIFSLYGQTTDGTETEIFCNGTGNSERMAIPSDTTWAFTGRVVARRTDADNESAGWEIKGVIDNNAGTTAAVGTISVTSLGDDSSGTWVCSVTADDTNDALVIKVTGEASKTIRWLATVDTTEIRG